MNIKNNVIKIVEENGIEINDIGKFSNMDSISFISMIVDIEQAFEIVLPDEVIIFNKLDSVDNIVEIINIIVNNR